MGLNRTFGSAISILWACAALFFAAMAVGQQIEEEGEPKLSAGKAALLVKKTDAALMQIFILGIIGAVSSSETVVLPNGSKMPVGIQKDQCDKLAGYVTDIASDVDYSAAIERLVTLGIKQRSMADSQLRFTTQMRRQSEAARATAQKRCDELPHAPTSSAR